MNNEIQIFNNPEFGQIRTIEIDGQIYFVGIDVAKFLKYTRPSEAVLDHVNEEDTLKLSYNELQRFNVQNRQNDVFEKFQNGTFKIPTRGWTVINESGLYSLILARQINKKDNSDVSQKIKRFKRWVTSEVLPTIRKTGSYNSNPQKLEEHTTIHTEKLTIKVTCKILYR